MTSTLVYTTCNRSPLLRRSLRRLGELTQPDHVLVVDDGGNDGCERVCDEAREWLDCDVQYVYTHNPGDAMCSHARNVALKLVNSDFFITSEPEMYFETDIIAQMLADVPSHLREIINVGRVLHEQPPGSGGCRCGCGQDKHETINWSATWICLYRREWLLAVGGWDEEFPDFWGWDDVDLSSRLRISGLGQLNDLNMTATHLWHPSRICDQSRNEAYFKSKGFHGDERHDHPHLVANKGVENWGVARPRP